MNIRKLIWKLFKRKSVYYKRTMKLMEELSPEDLELLISRTKKVMEPDA